MRSTAVGGICTDRSNGYDGIGNPALEQLAIPGGVGLDLWASFILPDSCQRGGFILTASVALIRALV